MSNGGSDQDLSKTKSHFLTREEVIRRRLRRVEQLAGCYRRHYWALMHQLKSKHRQYYWTYGNTPFQNHHKNNVVNHVLRDDDDDDFVVRCASSRCKSKAMALTSYCYSHILADSDQKLYRGCKFVLRNLETGPRICSKPVLRSRVPLACPTHYQLGKKLLTRAVRMGGYIFPSNRNYLNPKFHVLVAEIVSQIQILRKLVLYLKQ